MNVLLQLPWVPFLSLVAIVPLIVWQVRAYLKEKQRNRTPKVPQINLETHKENTKIKDVKNVTLITNLKARNKNSKKTSLVFSITIVIFVIVNVFIVTFYLNSRKLTYLPRATDSVSPTLTNLNPLEETKIPTNVPTKEPTPETTLSITPTTISVTTKPTVATIISPTTTPTKAAVQTPTANPTLLAQAYNVPTYAPSPTKTPKPTQTPTESPAKTPLITKSQTTIPVVGIGQFSVVLGVVSLFFLILGLVL